MSQQDNELLQLWFHSTKPEADPAEIARLAGQASLKRFDRALVLRNVGQYAAGVLLFSVFVWNLVHLRSVALNLIAMVCVGLGLAILWWQHRDLEPLDPSADSRAYRTAMLARIDKQIRLMNSYRFWYLSPLSIPFLWGILDLAMDDVTSISWNLFAFMALFAATAWLSENWGVRRLQADRAKIEGLYDE